MKTIFISFFNFVLFFPQVAAAIRSEWMNSFRNVNFFAVFFFLASACTPPVRTRPSSRRSRYTTCGAKEKKRNRNSKQFEKFETRLFGSHGFPGSLRTARKKKTNPAKNGCGRPITKVPEHFCCRFRTFFGRGKKSHEKERK